MRNKLLKLLGNIESSFVWEGGCFISSDILRAYPLETELFLKSIKDDLTIKLENLESTIIVEEPEEIKGFTRSDMAVFIYKNTPLTGHDTTKLINKLFR